MSESSRQYSHFYWWAGSLVSCSYYLKTYILKYKELPPERRTRLRNIQPDHGCIAAPKAITPPVLQYLPPRWQGTAHWRANDINNCKATDDSPTLCSTQFHVKKHPVQNYIAVFCGKMPSNIVDRISCFHLRGSRWLIEYFSTTYLENCRHYGSACKELAFTILR
jgi:hypothetical protein